jgi:paraquat-inducible protein B
MGIDIGEVVSINTEFDPVRKKFTVPVVVRIYPERLSSRRLNGPKTGRLIRDPKANYDALVAQGLRAQLRTGNLLTGQLYIALDFFPDAPKAKIDWSTDPVEFPTIQGSLTDLREAATRIMAKLDKIDFESIGSNLQQTLQGTNSVVKKVDKVEFEAIGTDLRQTLQSTTRLMDHLDTQVVPEAKGMIEDARRALVSADKLLASDSPLLMDTQAAMSEIARAARSVRILSDYLEQHPEALISGKKEDGK